MSNKNTKSERIVDFIHEVYQKIGPRPAGSREEKLAAKLIKGIFTKYSDEVITENFDCNPRSLQHLINLMCICYCLALLSYLFYPLAGVLLIIFAFANLILLRVFDIRLIDMFFPKFKSQNVIAKIKPVKEAKEVLIFSAHIDSPFVMKLFEDKYRNYTFILQYLLIGSFISLGVVNALKVFSLIPSVLDYLYLIPFAGIAVVVFFQHVMVTYEKSFGANDNLTGISMLIGLSKHLFYHRPENVEIWLCAFGAEEPGTVGSKFFVKNNLERLKNNVKVINFDSLTGGDLYVITGETDVFSTHDKNMVNLLREAANNIDFPLGLRPILGGSTDATPFTWAKIPATSLVALDKKGIPLKYHLKDDLPQYVSEDKLQNVFKLCLESIRLLGMKYQEP